MRNEQERDRGLDIARGIAIIMDVLGHALYGLHNVRLSTHPMRFAIVMLYITHIAVVLPDLWNDVSRDEYAWMDNVLVLGRSESYLALRDMGFDSRPDLLANEIVHERCASGLQALGDVVETSFDHLVSLHSFLFC